jgi:hypothetical protein
LLEVKELALLGKMPNVHDWCHITLQFSVSAVPPSAQCSHSAGWHVVYLLLICNPYKNFSSAAEIRNAVVLRLKHQ